MKDASSSDDLAVSLHPQPNDTRVLALAKAAILDLREAGQTITQQAIVERSKLLSQPASGKRVGLGRATFHTNPALGKLFAAVRSKPATHPSCIKGGRSRQYQENSRVHLAHKLCALRSVTARLERQMDLLCQGSQEPKCIAVINASQACERAWANRKARKASRSGQIRHKRSQEKVKVVIALIAARSPRRITQQSVADHLQIPLSTAMRYLEHARARLAFPQVEELPPRLSRLPKADIIVALKKEMAYQRALTKERNRISLSKLEGFKRDLLAATDLLLPGRPRPANDRQADPDC